jgi:precorrin-6B methylase 2
MVQNWLKHQLKRMLLPEGPRPIRILGGGLRGRRMLIDLHVDTQVWRGIYERSLQDWLTEVTKPDSVCLDVGAAEGWATLQMALRAPKGKVFAFEPSERGDDIAKNLDLNTDQPLAKVTIERCFVGCNDISDEIPIVTLDSYIQDRGVDHVDVVKIDVDGPELEVLAGAVSMLERWRPALCVETHSEELTAGVVEQLQSLGYATRIVEAMPHEHRPIGYNPTVFATAIRD